MVVVGCLMDVSTSMLTVRYQVKNLKSVQGEGGGATGEEGAWRAYPERPCAGRGARNLRSDGELRAENWLPAD